MDTKLIDELGIVQAQMSDLDRRAAVIKKILIATGEGSYDGSLFRATVSSSERKSLDMDAVREKLSAQFLTAHTEIKEVFSVRVVSRS